METTPRFTKPYRAAVNGDWNALKGFYMRLPDSITEPLTVSKDTAVHLAVYSGRTELVEYLLGVEPEVVIQKNKPGNTVLYEVATTGNIEMAKAVLEFGENEGHQLLEIRNERGETPLFRAAACGKSEMVRCLADKLRTMHGHLRREDSTTILHIAILGQYFETALELLKLEEEKEGKTTLNFAKMEDGLTCLQLLANMPSAFKSGTHMGKLKRLLYFCLPSVDDGHDAPYRNSSKRDEETGTGDRAQTNKTSNTGYIRVFRLLELGWPAIKELWDLKKNHDLALMLVKILVKGDQSWMLGNYGMSPETISVGRARLNPIGEVHESLPKSSHGDETSSSDDSSDDSSEDDDDDLAQRQDDQSSKKNEIALLAAAGHGIIEIVKAILEVYPQAIEYVNDEGANILHVAVRHRRKEVFDFLQSSDIPKLRLYRRIDFKGNSILHQAAVLGDYQVRGRPGEALHMQWEIQWFQQAKKAVPRHFINHRNYKGMTAQELFTKNHKKLVKQGQEWLMRTAESCSLVTVLIATVAFTSAYTVPGGSNDNGHPLLMKAHPFRIFTISDTLSLSFSLTSVVVFLSILTSRFHEQDFHRSLPLTLVLGLTTLFLAVAAMMVAFAATLVLMVQQTLHWAAIPIYFLACCPVTIFLILQFPLYVNVAWFTLGDILRLMWQSLPLPGWRCKDSIKKLDPVSVVLGKPALLVGVSIQELLGGYDREFVDHAEDVGCRL